MHEHNSAYNDLYSLVEKLIISKRRSKIVRTRNSQNPLTQVHQIVVMTEVCFRNHYQTALHELARQLPDTLKCVNFLPCTEGSMPHSYDTPAGDNSFNALALLLLVSLVK